MDVVRVAGVVDIGGADEAVTPPGNDKDDPFIALGGDENRVIVQNLGDHNVSTAGGADQLLSVGGNELGRFVSPGARSVHQSGGQQGATFFSEVVPIVDA